MKAESFKFGLHPHLKGIQAPNSLHFLCVLLLLLCICFPSPSHVKSYSFWLFYFCSLVIFIYFCSSWEPIVFFFLLLLLCICFPSPLSCSYIAFYSFSHPALSFTWRNLREILEAMKVWHPWIVAHLRGPRLWWPEQVLEHLDGILFCPHCTLRS